VDEGLPGGVDFTYYVQADLGGGTADHPNLSLPSDPAISSAVNDAPVATGETFSTKEDTLVTGNVLDNDTDDDSPRTILTAVLVSGPSHGALVLSPHGSFTYTPSPDSEGADSFM